MNGFDLVCEWIAILLIVVGSFVGFLYIRDWCGERGWG